MNDSIKNILHNFYRREIGILLSTLQIVERIVVTLLSTLFVIFAMRIVQNNSGLWYQRKTTQFRLENENSEPFVVSVILNLSI